MLIKEHCKSAKLIVCVLARGRSHEVLEALGASEHVLASEFVSIRSQSGKMDLREWDEMDALHVAVAPSYAESVFEMLYHMIEVEAGEGAYMFQVNVPWITHFELPEIPEQGVAISSLQHGESLPEGVDEKTAQALRILADLD